MREPRSSAVRWYYRATAAAALVVLVRGQVHGRPLDWVGFSCAAALLSLYIVQGESK